MKTEEQVREQIRTLERQRDDFVQQANLEVAKVNGAIAALESLLEPEPEAQEAEEVPEPVG